MNGFTEEQLENIKKTGRSGYLQGEFFHTGFLHNGCDNEMTERCRQIGKAVWAEEAKVYHDHPVQNGFQNPEQIDDVYKLAFREDRVDHDRKLLLERSKLLGFELHSNFGSPRVKPNPGVVCDLTDRLPKGYQEMKVLNVGIGSGESGVACQLPFLKFKQIDHLEIHWPYIDKARKQIWDSPHGFIQEDVRKFGDFYKYDLVIFSDILEHLKKQEAIDVINHVRAEAVKIMIFGPLENKLHQHRDRKDEIPSQDHLSLWTEQEFKDMGFKTEVYKDFHEEEGDKFDACWAFYYDRGATKFKEMIENGKNFVFTRLGDGELNCMHGAKGENTDKQQYSKKLGDELKEAYRYIVKQDNYYLAGWPLFMSPTDCVPLSDINTDGKVFIHNELLDERREFYKALKFSKRKKVFIGPKYLSDVVNFLNVDEFIEIPEVNSYSYEFNLVPEKDVIYMICGGMSAKVWMMKLLKQEKDITVIDFGSAFDPIFGRQSRTGQLSTEVLREYYRGLLEGTLLCQLAFKYKSDKTPLLNHGYTAFYHNIFKDKRNEVKKILEIGIGDIEIMKYEGYVTGASVFMWRDYFPNAEIYSCDIRKSQMIEGEERIHTYETDQSQSSQLFYLIDQTGKDFDLIIDDGSHITDHQIISARALIPFVKKGGYYIIEDVSQPERVVSQLPEYKCEVITFNPQAPDDRLIVVHV